MPIAERVDIVKPAGKEIFYIQVGVGRFFSMLLIPVASMIRRVSILCRELNELHVHESLQLFS